MRTTLILTIMLIWSSTLISQTTVFSCDTTFFDSGGATGNYPNQENLITTYCPTDTLAGNQRIRMVFSEFSVRGFDYLRVYDGTSITAPLIGEYSGTNSVFMHSAFLASDQCLTFHFVSNSFSNSSGWAARAYCEDIAPYISAEVCDNGIDDDGDGFTDLQDLECESSPDITTINCDAISEYYFPPVWQMNLPNDATYNAPSSINISTLFPQANVTITNFGNGFDTSFVVLDNELKSIVLDDEGVMLTDIFNAAETGQGIHVVSDVPIQAIYRINGDFNKALVTGKGPESWGRSFIAGSQVNTAIANPAGMARKENHFVSVLAIEDNTSVTFNVDLAMDGISTSSTVTLNRGESYLVKDPDNNTTVSGMKVTSDKNISILSGSMHTRTFAANDLDAGIDLLVPIKNIGSEYVIMRGGVDIDDEYTVITAIEDNTEVFLNDDTSPIATLNSGQFYRLNPNGNLGTPTYINTSFPVYVYHFTGEESEEVGMGLVGAVDECRGSNKVRFSRFTGGENSCQVIIEDNLLSSLTLNGALVQSLQDVTIVPIVGLSPAHSAINIPSTQLLFTNILEADNNFIASQLVGSSLSGTFGYLTSFESRLFVQDPNTGISTNVIFDTICGDENVATCLDVVGCGNIYDIIQISSNNGGTTTMNGSCFTYTPSATFNGSDTLNILFQNEIGTPGAVCYIINVSGVDIDLVDTLHACDNYVGSISATLSSGIEPYTVMWSNGTTSTTTNVVVSKDSTFYITATDFSGCEQIDSVFVDIHTNEPNEIITESGVFCSEEDVSIEANLAMESSGLWSGGQGTFADATNQMTTYSPTLAESGQYVTLYWTTTPHISCNVAMDSVVIRFKEDAIPVINISDVTISCDEDLYDPMHVGTINVISSSSPIVDTAIQYAEIMDLCGNTGSWERTITVTDSCGLSASIIQTIDINDSQITGLPSMPADTLVMCPDDIPAFQTFTITDNCGYTIESDTSTVVSGSFCGTDPLVHFRNWSFTDSCGNNTSHTQLIIVVDTIAPTIFSGPQDITVQCSSAVPEDQTLFAIDNCEGQISAVNVNRSNGGAGCVGDFEVITRTWIFTDQCGNQDSVSQRVTIVDTGIPSAAIGNPLISVSCPNDVPPAPQISANDFCGEEPNIVFNEISNNGSGCVGDTLTITRSWDITDQCNNDTTIFQIIHVVDTIKPTINGMLSDLAFMCEDDIPLPSNINATDNCGYNIPASYTESSNGGQGSVNDPLVFTRIYTYTDNCANSDSMVQQITIIDQSEPMAPEPPADISIACMSELPMAPELTASETCGSVITASGVDNVQLGDGCSASPTLITRTWTFDDGLGNVSTVSQMITIMDTIAPVLPAEPQDISISCAGEVPAALQFTAQDNCGYDVEGILMETVANQGGCSANPTVITRTWTFTDSCGNVSSFDRTISIQDTIIPVFNSLPADVTINCISDLPAMNDLDGMDNCFGSFSTQGTETTNGGQGCISSPEIISRTWTFTDDCNNVTNHTQTITIQDTLMPFFDVPRDVTLDCGSEYNVSITGDIFNIKDNCSSVSTSFSDVIQAGQNCDAEVTVLRIFSGIDQCSNTFVDTQRIFFIDTIPPELIVPVDLTMECGDGVDPFAMPAAPAMMSDNCSLQDQISWYYNDVPNILSGCEGSGTFTREWVATDQCGNSTVDYQQISVTDVTPPDLRVPNDITIQCGDDMTDLLLMGSAVVIPSACNVDVSMDYVDTNPMMGCNNTGVFTRMWWAEDGCGNRIELPQRVSIIDTMGPEITCQDLTITIEQGSEVRLPAVETMVSYADDCGDVTLALANQVFDCSNLSSTMEIEIMAFDDCNNMSTCISQLQISDNVAPRITCPSNMQRHLDFGECVAGVSFIVEAQDNCDQGVIEKLDNTGLDTNDEFPIGEYEMMYRAVDNFENADTCAFMISIVENPQQGGLICESQVNLSLDEDCELLVTPGMILTGFNYGCFEDFEIILTDANDVVIPQGQMLDAHYVGQNITATLIDLSTGNSCWSMILLEDKLPPVLTGMVYCVDCGADTSPEAVGFPNANAQLISQTDDYTYNVDGVDNCGPVEMIHIDTETSKDCTGEFSKMIVREWIATDVFGSKSRATDTIKIKKFDSDNIVFPPNYNGSDRPSLVCDEGNGNNGGVDSIGWHADADGLPLPESTFFSNGNVRWFGTGTPEGVMCDDVIVTYKDHVTNHCEGIACLQIIRKWTIIDHCNNDVITHQQYINIIDNKAPTISGLPDLVEASMSHHNCLGTATLPIPTVTDNCSEETTYQYSLAGYHVTIDNQGNQVISNLEPGMHIVYLNAFDCCGNVAMDSIKINVEDNITPQATCLENIVISTLDEFTKDGVEYVTKIPASVLDNGSYDDCGPIYLKARKESGSCAVDHFDDFVLYCCEEVGGDSIRTKLRVYDVDPGPGKVDPARELAGGDLFGRFNDCWSYVKIEDKKPPILTAPSNITVSCKYPYTLDDLDAAFGTIQTEAYSSITADDILCPGQPGYDPSNPLQVVTRQLGNNGFVKDVCDVTVRDTFSVREECNFTEITRTFVATDAFGNSSSATQRIRIESCIPFYISDTDCTNKDRMDGVIWPCDREFTGCGLDITPEQAGRPIINNLYCKAVGVQYEDQIFDINGSGCKKLKRTWTLTTLCDNQTWSYTQSIHVFDRIDPIIEVCQDTTVCADKFCSRALDLNIVASDNCTNVEGLRIDYHIDLDSDKVIEKEGWGAIEDYDFPIGRHTVTWIVGDQCGNFKECTQIVTVENCQVPDIYCLGEVAVALPADGSELDIWPIDIALSANGACGSDIQLSFSDNPEDTVLYISCVDFVTNPDMPVRIYAIDENGNNNYCNATISIGDNANICDTIDLMGTISGKVISSKGEAVSQANYQIYDGLNMVMEGAIEQGAFEYVKDKNQAYNVAVIKDDNHLNGVSTKDLILIQRHILGIKRFDSPYKYIAADVNNSESVSAADLSELRKLLLGITDRFRNNTSWRFVNDEGDINEQVWPFEEMGTVPSNHSQVSFTGVKIGDIDDSNEMNLMLPSVNERSYEFYDYELVDEANETTLRIEIEEGVVAGLELSFEIEKMANPTTFRVFINDEETSHFNVKDGMLNIISIEQGLLSQAEEIKVSVLNSTAEDVQLSVSPSSVIFKEDLGEVSLRRKAKNIEKTAGLRNIPNPFVERTDLTFYHPVAEQATIYVKDMSGKVIKVLDFTTKIGENIVTFDGSDLQGGMFLFTLNTSNGTSTIKAIKLE